MAEFNIKTIAQLQQLIEQSERLNGEDYIVVYETEEGTTNRISLNTLKQLILQNEREIGADSTFKVQDTNLAIGKKSILVPSSEIDTYFAEQGISLKINDSDSISKITRITGDGIGITEGTTTLNISQTAPSVTVTDGTNNFNIKDKDSSLHFDGAVTVDSETGIVHINDKDTVLQAITTDGASTNISKVKSGGNVSFNISTDDNNQNILTIGLDSTSSAAQAFSLKAYEATKVSNNTYTCEAIKSFDQGQIVAIYFSSPIVVSPVTLNGYEIAFYNQHGTRDSNEAINRIIQNYAILKKQPYTKIITKENGTTDSEQTFEYRILFADAVQTLYQDWTIDSSNDEPWVNTPGIITVGSQAAGVSFTVLTPDILFEQDNESHALRLKTNYIEGIKLIDLEPEGFTVNLAQLTDNSGNAISAENRIPAEYISADVGNVYIVDGQQLTYDVANEAMIFTNSTHIDIPDSGGSGGEGGGESSSSGAKLTRLVCSTKAINNIYTLDSITSIPQGFYLIQFDYGLQNNVTGLALKINNANIPAKFIYYDGASSEQTEIKQSFIDDHDSLLFYYKTEDNLFYFISNDDANADRIKITHNDDENTIVLSQSGKYYTVNKADYTSKELREGDSGLIQIEDSDTFTVVNFNLPTDEDIDWENRFLNGAGNWSTPTNYLNIEDTIVSNLELDDEFLNLDTTSTNPKLVINNQQLREFLINIVYPIGSYLQVSVDSGFNPDPQGSGGALLTTEEQELGVHWQQLSSITIDGIEFNRYYKTVGQQAG